MLEFLQDTLQYIENHKELFIAFGAFLTSIGIETTPKISFSPWSSLFNWLGKQLTSDLRNDIETMNEKIDSNRKQSHDENMATCQKLDDFIKETQMDNQAIMRDRLLRIYHTTLKKGYILEKDNENFHSLLKRYKANGGNSYILNDVAPRMESFKVYLSENDAESYYKEHGNY